MQQQVIYKILEEAVEEPKKVNCVDAKAAKRLRDRMQRIRAREETFKKLRFEVHGTTIHIKHVLRNPVLKVEPLV